MAGRRRCQSRSRSRSFNGHPDVLQGKPVIRGTRIPVELLLRKLAEGATIEDLLDAYPRLASDDIRAALDHAVLSPSSQ
ncbi:MAG TPA: DUF433 domain-containing protein [Bryobacteraceae bacterium]